MEEKIKAFARSLGAVACGISEGERENESIIVCLFPYRRRLEGNLSIHAMGRDYHKVIGEKLGLLGDFLHTLFPTSSVSCQVDIGDYVDKHYAQKSGVGFYGKNNLIIHEDFGSFTFIGFCRIDQPLRPDSPNENTCLGCSACIKACPGGAISEDGSFCEEKCASFISQKRGTLSDEERMILEKSGLVWGCDRCQTVCPHNQNVPDGLSDFDTLLKTSLTAKELESLSNREFSEKFGDFSFAYRGKNVLLRNCRILEGIKDEKEGKI